jgi:dTDP-4-dehydrorhamnose 3,5-epimerase
MLFRETPLAGAFLIEPELLKDDRGFFARTFCQKEFAEHGLETQLRQCNISFNRHLGTLRGLHFQADPYPEVRLVRCTSGAIDDVIVDLRPESQTFKQHFAAALTAENWLMLYVPKGFAHGFLTRADNTEVFYQMSEYYSPAQARGVRWNDPAFGIKWLGEVRVISERDRTYPDFVV